MCLSYHDSSKTRNLWIELELSNPFKVVVCTYNEVELPTGPQRGCRHLSADELTHEKKSCDRLFTIREVKRLLVAGS